MIRTFSDKTTRDVYDGTNSRYARKVPKELHAKAQRLLDQLNAAPSLEFMRVPPGNKLEKLSGDMKYFLSLRINEQWRIIFIWKGNDAYEVRITDYH